MECGNNPKKLLWFVPYTGHCHLQIFKIEPQYDYEYHVHHKCEYCHRRTVEKYVPESSEILDWIAQEATVAKLRGKVSSDDILDQIRERVQGSGNE